MNPGTQHGRVVNGLMRSMAGLALLVIVAYVSDRGIGLAAAADLFSIGAGTLNWTAAGSWSNVGCGGAAGGGPPIASSTVTICAGTTVRVNGAAAASFISIQPTGTLLGGAGNTLSIGNSTNTATTVLLSLNGIFTAETGTVRFIRNANSTMVGGATSSITFNNLQIAPGIGGNRTYTIGGGSINRLTVNGDFSVIPPDVSIATARTLTVNDGSLNSATIVGNLTLNMGDAAASNDTLTFNAGGIPWTAARIVLGRALAGPVSTLVAGASTITLNGGSGTLFTRDNTGRFTAGTSSVAMVSALSMALTSGSFDATATSTSAFNNLTISPAANGIIQSLGAGTVVVAGRLTIGNGANTGVVSAGTNNTPIDVGGAVSISANATLIAPGTDPFLVGGNWVNAGTFSANLGTVILDGAAVQTLIGTGNTVFHNLTSTNSNVSGVLMASSQTVNGTLTLGANPFRVANNILTLNGPTIAGTPSSLSAGVTSSLSFGGTSAGVQLPFSVIALNNLTVNNQVTATTQAALTLNNNLSVVGVLTLTNGVVAVGVHATTGLPNTLTVGASCPGSIVRTNGWVSGELRMVFPAGPPTCTFPIGDPPAAVRNYAPIQLVFTALTTPGRLTAAVPDTVLLNKDHPNTTAGTSGIDPTLSVNRYWTLENSTLAGTYTATFTYIGGAPVDNDSLVGVGNYRVRRGASCSGTGVSRTCTPWGSLAVPSVANATTTTVAGITIAVDATLQSDFAIGQLDTSTNFLREKQFIYTRELY